MIDKNSIVHIGAAKDTLSEIPTPPNYLCTAGKKHFISMAKTLIKLDRLKEEFLPALEIFATAMAQYEFANRQIIAKNREDSGSGYIQTYRTKATNISTEVVLRNDAESTLFKCFKQFGMDPRSEKELQGANKQPDGYGDLFTQFLNGTK